MNIMRNIRQRGFTLIELLIVIAIIAILAVIVIVAINPQRQFAQANNTTRGAQANTILNAIGQYVVDNRGSLPAAISGLANNTPREICGRDASTAGQLVTDVNCAVAPLVNLYSTVADLNQTYIVSLPHDPQCNFPAETPTGGAICAQYGIGYTVAKSANGRVSVCAKQAQDVGAGVPVICVSR